MAAAGLFKGQMLFLSPDQQCQCTEGNMITLLVQLMFLDPEDGSQKATLVVVLIVVVVIGSLKIPKAFLIRSVTKLCVHVHAHIPYRSTVSDFT